MNAFENEPKINRTKEAKAVIFNAPNSIEEEFQKMRNSWIACFISCLDAVGAFLSSKRVKDKLGLEKYNAVQDKPEALKKKSSFFG